MANPWHDSEGNKAADRDALKARLDEALTSNDFERYYAERKNLERIEASLNAPLLTQPQEVAKEMEVSEDEAWDTLYSFNPAPETLLENSLVNPSILMLVNPTETLSSETNFVTASYTAMATHDGLQMLQRLKEHKRVANDVQTISKGEGEDQISFFFRDSRILHARIVAAEEQVQWRVEAVEFLSTIGSSKKVLHSLALEKEEMLRQLKERQFEFGYHYREWNYSNYAAPIKHMEQLAYDIQGFHDKAVFAELNEREVKRATEVVRLRNQ